MTPSPTVPELLAPAGSLDCLPAAVAGGADAVYLGCGTLNARARANNIPVDLLDDVVAYLHHHRRRCLLTVNTIIGPGRWDEAIALAHRAQQATVDAVIVQDIGLAAALHQAVPELRLHASTQMTIHEPSQIPALAALGLRRIVLARELGPDEVARCAAVANKHGIEIECFVHGALCYGFSGQCLVSAARDGRSADHGRCAQNCRFTYRVHGHDAQPLAMRDLCLIDHLPAMSAAGVSALKIEGRLKDPLYVYTVTAAYRAALDALAAGRQPAAQLRDRLRRVFARPFTAAPWGQEAPARLESEAEVGEVRLVEGSRREAWAVLSSPTTLRPGLGLRTQITDTEDDGFTIIGAQAVGPGRWRCRLRLRPDGPPLRPGTHWVINSDQDLAAAASAAMATVPLPRLEPRRPQVDIHLEAALGHPSRLHFCDQSGRQVGVDGPPAETAQGRPLDYDTLALACGTLRDQGLSRGELVMTADPTAFLPARVIKDMRRRACSLWRDLPPAPSKTPSVPLPPWPTRSGRRPLHVAIDNPESASIALEAGADAVWLDDPHCDWSAARPPPAYAALPDRVLLRPPSALACPAMCAQWAAGVVAGQWAVLDQALAAAVPVIADAGLKVANPMTAQVLVERGITTWLYDPGEIWAHGDSPITIDGEGWAGLMLAWGRPILMQSRHDHELHTGAQRRLDGPDGSYHIIRYACGLNILRPAHPIDRRSALANVPCGWLLEMSGCTPEHIASMVSDARQRLGGD